jgi:hypothetical protein
MSEAEIPNPNSCPDSIIPLRQPTAITPLTLPSPEESEWTTVNFPNAFDVDELVRRESIDRITIVEQHNQALHDRILYLEVALYEVQQDAQPPDTQPPDVQPLASPQSQSAPLAANEASVSLTAGPQVLAKHRQELMAAQAQSTKIFQELALAHQAAHRQQVLVETLTEQLKLGQERIAQLERECSTAQLRYSEQVQTVYQLEHSSRDLRSRLARQQRYTLQFKAALEKCLDVPPVNPLVDLQGTLDNSLSEGLGEAAVVAPINKLNIPKASPVQPWSAPSNAEAAPDPSLQAWVNAFLSDSEFLPIEEPCPDNVISLQNYKADAEIALDGESPFINLADPVVSPSAHSLTVDAELNSRFITLDSPALGNGFSGPDDLRPVLDHRHRLPSPSLWDGAIQPINVQVSTGLNPAQLDFRSPEMKAAGSLGAPGLPKFAAEPDVTPVTPVRPSVAVADAPPASATLDLFDDAPHLDLWASAEPLVYDQPQAIGPVVESVESVESIATPAETLLAAESVGTPAEHPVAPVEPTKSPFITLTTSGRK